MPKEGGKGKGKAKAPAFFTAEEDTAPFGLRANEIVRTPLGLTGTVIGVKYEDPANKTDGRLWVKYDNGHEAPLEPKQGAGQIAALGYKKCSDADHIRRDVSQQEHDLQEVEEKRRAVDEIIKLKQQGLPIPAHLLPPTQKRSTQERKGQAKVMGKGLLVQ